MSISLQRLPFDLHVLCAPPAFILSQDQTLLFLVSIFCLSTSYKSKILSFSQALFASCFLLKTFKNFTCSVLQNILCFSTASVYSLKDFTVYFSMYFFVPLCGTIFIILHVFFIVNTFF